MENMEKDVFTITKEAPEVDSGKKSFIIELLETFLSSIVVLFAVYMWIAMPEMVYGASMEPNFYTGERILVEKVTKHFRDFERGDIVVLNPPESDYTDYLKRIVGLPGEIVKIKDCGVYISKDGEKFLLVEDYLGEDVCTSAGPRLKEGRSVRIDADHYFVLGDNRDESSDSRFFGFVEEKRIQGRVVFRFWPINKLGFI